MIDSTSMHSFIAVKDENFCLYLHRRAQLVVSGGRAASKLASQAAEQQQAKKSHIACHLPTCLTWLPSYLVGVF